MVPGWGCSGVMPPLPWVSFSPLCSIPLIVNPSIWLLRAPFLHPLPSGLKLLAQALPGKLDELTSKSPAHPGLQA